MLDLKKIDADAKFIFKLATPEIVSDLTVIHYGNFKYNKRLFKKIKNKNWVKPEGGLWTSPILSKHSWKDWCLSEQFRECKEENSFKLKFKTGTNILIIDSSKDLQNLPSYKQEDKEWLKYSRDLFKHLDFEFLVDIGVDAIWLTKDGQWHTRFSQPMNLYGWDCETVFIMNKNCCYEPITRNVIFEKTKILS